MRKLQCTPLGSNLSVEALYVDAPISKKDKNANLGSRTKTLYNLGRAGGVVGGGAVQALEHVHAIA